MRILIVKTSSMGDVIHTLPALTDAGKIYPDISFDWVVEENFAEIPSWHQLVNKVIPVALRRWRKHPLTMLKKHEWRDFRKTLKAEQYDFIIDAQGLIKSAIIARMANGISCGMDKHTARESWVAYGYQRKFAISKQQHAITRVRQLFAKVLNYQLPDNVPDYGIKATSDEENYLVFIHGTSRTDKLWPEDHWVDIVKLAAKTGYAIKIPWHGDVELKRAQYIAAQHTNVQVLPTLNLTELADILAKAKAVVAVDTGLGHLAAALNVPTFSLYGVTDPKLIGTWGAIVRHVIAPTCNMGDITAHEVWETLENYLAKDF